MAERKKIRFVTNPFSGTKKKDQLDALIRNNLDLTKFEYEICLTQYSGHARLLSKEAVDKNYYMVAAVGGDGTVNEVASSLVHQNTILSVIPFGSGNGFAMHIGLGRQAEYSLKAINTGIVQKIDTCLANDRFFLNIAGIGLDATVAFKTKANKKRGFLPYFIATLKESLSFKYLSLEIETENEKFSGQYAMAVVANASIYGYNFTIVPNADLQDGMLDVLLVVKKPVFRYFLMAFRMLNRTFHKSPLVKLYKVREVTIKIKDKEHMHVDGEGFESDKTVTFKVIPSSLNVLFPSIQVK
ncbi:MAG: diacylglycerol kinase family lipid kinase [Saprospiraceae bacterium]|nr:diacylglycerol kinase family lipid kinase [Saprospiraceae bacterium]